MIYLICKAAQIPAIGGMLRSLSLDLTVVKSVDVLTIRQRRNSDTDSNGNFSLYRG